MKQFRQNARRLLLSQYFWLLTASVFLISRLATFLFPFDSDHWIFFYVGKHWFDGKTLYLQVWDHKSPVIFAINGIMSRLFGDNIVLHRIFLALVAALGVWLFYATAIRLYRFVGRNDIELDARIATLLFAFWASLSQFTNSGNDTEAFGVIALLVAAYCYFRYIEDKTWKWLLYSGIGVSYLVFLKINFSILLIPFIVDFIIRERKNIKRFIGLGFVWALPTVIQAIGWLSYFMPRKLVGDFWIAMVSFNGKYLRSGWAGNLSSQKIFIVILAVAFTFFVSAFYFTWVARKKERRSKILLLMAGSALFFSIILGTFYSHYYLVVIPYFCLLTGAYWREITSSKVWMTLGAIALIGSFMISLKQLYNSFYGSAATEAKQMSNAAKYVEANTSPSDTIIYDGYGATFYQLAHRDSGSRFISASHPLIDERDHFGYGFDNKYIGDMETTQPKYVIVNLSTVRIYNENTRVANYFKRHYVLEKSLPGYEIWRREL